MSRVLVAWAFIVAVLTAVAGAASYSEGILVHHGAAPAEVLYGWPAVRYLCPRIAVALVLLSAAVAIAVAILEWGRR